MTGTAPAGVDGHPVARGGDGPEIVTLTLNPALDVFTEVDRMEPGPKLRCSASLMHPGGGGINVARAVHRLGGTSHAVFAAGGGLGAELVELMALEEVPHTPVPIDGWTRQSVTVAERSGGARFRLVFPGPSLTPSERARCIDVAVDRASAAGELVASGSLPPGAPTDLYAQLARRAARAGIRLLLDSAGPPCEAALEVGVHLVRCNQREARRLAGDDSAADLEALAEELVRRGAAHLVLMARAHEGATLTGSFGTFRARPPDVPQASPVGAGDSQLAAVALGLAQGWPPGTALQYGVAAAAAAQLTTGTELCRRHDAERLFVEMTGTPLPEPV